MTKSGTTRPAKMAKIVNPTKRVEAPSASVAASKRADSPVPPKRAEDFWATFTLSQKEAFLGLGGPDVHGPKRRANRRG